MPEIAVRTKKEGAAYIADVTVKDRAITAHRVRVSLAELDRYGGRDDVAGLVRRSFEFLLARERNISILREFSLSTIEQYFPEYAKEIRRAPR
ncbi:MAG TPA: hypothetical protein VJQ09_07330 [Candidatus Limnocylindria bacterium]|nr:hypothetical protein [Candidatus Limnocylindria bacterium]